MPSVDLLSTSTIKLTMQYLSDTNSDPMNLAIGTGFFWKSDQKIFLITNWHNASGRNFETKKPLDTKYSALPNQIEARHFVIKSNGKIEPRILIIPLFREDNPLWIEHPNNADVVAIFLGESDKFGSVTYVNEIECNMAVHIAMEVFILGYPQNISTYGFPIWKRASIASEPQCQGYTDKCTFLVDTATTKGMCGAPVFAISKGVYLADDGNKILSKGVAKKFLGIYSGRLGKDQFEAQLGIVWKNEIIQEIVAQYNK